MLRHIVALALAFASFATATAQDAAPQSAPYARPATRPTAGTPIEDGYYTNHAGQQVHRPAHTDNDQPPAGASARCRDGTFSYSMSRRGTCSHHGGVAAWL